LEKFWETVKDYIIAFGWAKGVFTIFFFLAHYWLFKMYNGRLADRQEEINRLAADNHEYRDRFLAMLDKHFEINKDLGGLIKPGQSESPVNRPDTEPKPPAQLPERARDDSKKDDKPPGRRPRRR